MNLLNVFEAHAIKALQLSRFVFRVTKSSILASINTFLTPTLKMIVHETIKSNCTIRLFRFKENLNGWHKNDSPDFYGEEVLDIPSVQEVVTHFI